MTTEVNAELNYEFIYQRYQAIVEHFESGDLRVTFGILALSAGIVAKDLVRPDSSLPDALYGEESFFPILIFFLWGTAYSAWNRHRVLHAVKNLIEIEHRMAIDKAKILYWTGSKVRPWIYLLLSPWPWLLFLFAAGSCYSSFPQIKYLLFSIWGSVMAAAAFIFYQPCRDVRRPDSTKPPADPLARDPNVRTAFDKATDTACSPPR